MVLELAQVVEAGADLGPGSGQDGRDVVGRVRVLLDLQGPFLAVLRQARRLRAAEKVQMMLAALQLLS
jgi:hypothetical protein